MILTSRFTLVKSVFSSGTVIGLPGKAGAPIPHLIIKGTCSLEGSTSALNSYGASSCESVMIVPLSVSPNQPLFELVKTNLAHCIQMATLAMSNPQKYSFLVSGTPVNKGIPVFNTDGEDPTVSCGLETQ